MFSTCWYVEICWAEYWYAITAAAAGWGATIGGGAALGGGALGCGGLWGVEGGPEGAEGVAGACRGAGVRWILDPGGGDGGASFASVCGVE